MTKETFINIIDVIASRLLDEKREQGKRYNPFSIKDAGSPDYDIWNMLTNNKKLAKTSATPGKTLLINHFIINKEWYLVDLPGYGYKMITFADTSSAKLP